MGARTAIKQKVTPEVYELISRLLGVDYQFNLCPQRYSLVQPLDQELQGLICTFARRRPRMYDQDTHWSLSFPRLDVQPLAEFGA